MLRKTIIGLCGFLCLFAISILIIIVTMNDTIMNRVTVKRWLSDSHIYQTDFVALFTQQDVSKPDAAQPDELYQQSGGALSGQAIITALSHTFDSAFIQQQTEQIIDNGYDYADGKQASFGFSIPLDQKKDTFVQELTKSLAVEAAKLPVCTDELLSNGTYCRPASVSVDQLASQAAAQQVAQFGLFDKPFTSASLAPKDQPATPSPADAIVAGLPMIRTIVNLLFIILPIVIIASLGGVALAAPKGTKLHVYSKLSKHVFWVLFVSLVIAVATSLIMANNNGGLLALLGGSSNQLAGVIAPLVQIVTVDLSNYTAIVTGIACVVCAAAWAGLHIVRKQQVKQSPEVAPVVSPATLAPAVATTPVVAPATSPQQPPHR